MKNKKMPKDALFKTILNAVIVSSLLTIAGPLLEISTIE
jgi:hypothetical protein